MKKHWTAALAAAATSVGLASAQGGDALPPGMKIDEIRATISQMADVKIVKEQATQDGVLMLVTLQDIPFVVAPNCKGPGGDCTMISMLSVFPAELKSNATFINAYNASSPFGWLATDPSTGRVATRHGALLMGNTKTGLQMNLLGFAVFHSVIGEALLKGGGGANTISLKGVEVAPRERIDVADSRPATLSAIDSAALRLISSEDAEKGLVAALGDAQKFGRLRKISNEILGR